MFELLSELFNVCLCVQFDVKSWLEECRPQAADRKRMLEVFGSALMSCGAEPSSDIKLVFDVSDACYF
jgi:hypothetical protein